MKVKVITFLLLAILCVAVVLLSKDIKEQEKQIETLEKHQGYHQLRLGGQMDKLMSHDAKIRGIVEYLNERNTRSSFVDAR
tara:strand:- start:50 stop:292 length:243 start_codon:yes stop_codon:yes gene_type:complete